jgi:hypothetical protein
MLPSKEKAFLRRILLIDHIEQSFQAEESFQFETEANFPPRLPDGTLAYRKPLFCYSLKSLGIDIFGIYLTFWNVMAIWYIL